MPYIPEKEKNEMSDYIENLRVFIESKGDLNYVICELVGRLIVDSDKISYTQMSEWIDAVHDAETELRRRLLFPYEDLKIEENGDVPSFIRILERMERSENGNES